MTFSCFQLQHNSNNFVCPFFKYKAKPCWFLVKPTRGDIDATAIVYYTNKNLNYIIKKYDPKVT